MSKCLKCGSPLPPVGDCPRCQAGAAASPPSKILDRDLNLDRRRDSPPNVPSFDELTKPRAPQPTVKPPAPAAPRTVSSAARPAVKPPNLPPARPAPPPVPHHVPVNEPLLAPPPPVSKKPTRSEEDSLLGSGQSFIQEFADAPGEKRIPTRAEPESGVWAHETSRSAIPSDKKEVRAIPAAIWKRLVASAVDFSVIAGVVSLFLWAALAITGRKAPPSHLTGLDSVMHHTHAWEPVLIPILILGVILTLAYSVVFAVIWEGRTLGRRLMGLQLVDESGLSPTPARTIARALLALVSFAFFLGGFWLLLFDRRRQTLHDKLTQTFIIEPV